MTNATDNSTTILAAIDLTSSSDDVLARTFALASQIPRSEIFVLHVLDGRAARASERDDSVVGASVSRVQAVVARAATSTHASRVPRFGVEVIRGLPATEIARFADRIDADVIVVGTHADRRTAHSRIGSVASAVVAETPRSVLFVHIGRGNDPSGAWVPPAPRSTRGEDDPSDPWRLGGLRHHGLETDRGTIRVTVPRRPACSLQLRRP